MENDVSGLSPRRDSLHVGGRRLSYLEWGHAGRDCLLLHGITSNARTWWRLAPELARTGFHVVALDMPGHGESDEIADHRVAAVTDLAAGAIRQLGLTRVMLIGHSWGGAVALALAVSQHADLLDRVVLIDPALVMSREVGGRSVPIFSKGLGAPIEITSPVLRAANPDWHDEDIHWKAEAVLQCRPGAVEGFFTRSGDWDLTPAFADVQMPLLMLVADPAYTIINPQTRTAVAQALAAATAGRMIVVPGTTHNMYRGAGYEPTLSALVRWLRSE